MDNYGAIDSTYIVCCERSVAILYSRNHAQDCFVAMLLAMTQKDVIATVFSSRHCERSVAILYNRNHAQDCFVATCRAFGSQLRLTLAMTKKRRHCDRFFVPSLRAKRGNLVQSQSRTRLLRRYLPRLRLAASAHPRNDQKDVIITLSSTKTTAGYFTEFLNLALSLANLGAMTSRQYTCPSFC